MTSVDSGRVADATNDSESRRSIWWRKTKSGSKTTFDKAWAYADKLGAPVNKLSNKLGSEAFWPTSLDKESEKAARILRSFCKDGFYDEELYKTPEGPQVKQRVLKKIPASVIQKAKGLAIFTTMRTGLWVSGAGGSGIVVGRKEDGTWSDPSGIMLHTAALGFLVGVDIYDCVLVLNTDAAVNAFSTWRATIGGEVSAVAGPVGAGAMLESEVNKRASPIFTYLKSRGFYAGVQIDGTVVIERSDENERFYGAKYSAKEILAGKIASDRTFQLKMLKETLKAAQGDSNVDAAALPSDPSPADYEVIGEEHQFGVPDKEDPDPYGVLALERAGMEIREAGSQKRVSVEQFEYKPSISSPVRNSYRKSVDSGSNRSSIIGGVTSRYVTSEMGTQTEEGPSDLSHPPSIAEVDEEDAKNSKKATVESDNEDNIAVGRTVQLPKGPPPPLPPREHHPSPLANGSTSDDEKIAKMKKDHEHASAAARATIIAAGAGSAAAIAEAAAQSPKSFGSRPQTPRTPQRHSFIETGSPGPAIDESKEAPVVAELPVAETLDKEDAPVSAVDAVKETEKSEQDTTPTITQKEEIAPEKETKDPSRSASIAEPADHLSAGRDELEEPVMTKSITNESHFSATKSVANETKIISENASSSQEATETKAVTPTVETPKEASYFPPQSSSPTKADVEDTTETTAATKSEVKLQKLDSKTEPVSEKATTEKPVEKLATPTVTPPQATANSTKDHSDDEEESDDDDDDEYYSDAELEIVEHTAISPQPIIQRIAPTTVGGAASPSIPGAGPRVVNVPARITPKLPSRNPGRLRTGRPGTPSSLNAASATSRAGSSRGASEDEDEGRPSAELSDTFSTSRDGREGSVTSASAGSTAPSAHGVKPSEEDATAKTAEKGLLPGGFPDENLEVKEDQYKGPRISMANIRGGLRSVDSDDEDDDFR